MWVYGHKCKGAKSVRRVCENRYFENKALDESSEEERSVDGVGKVVSFILLAANCGVLSRGSMAVFLYFYLHQLELKPH